MLTLLTPHRAESRKYEVQSLKSENFVY